MKYTIVMPVYNSEKYVGDILDDFVKLNFKDIELIIVDDGSTDDSSTICKSKKDARIRYFYKENGGVSSARNFGINKVNGEYLAFVDSDDKINFSILLEKFQQVASKKIDLLITLSYENYNNIFPKFNKYCSMDKLILTEEINSPCNKIYNFNLIRNNDIKFDERYDLGEDLLFNLEFYSKAEKIELSNKQYYTYVKHENSLTTKFRENKLKILFDVNNVVLENYSFANDNVKKAINAIKIKNCYSYLINISDSNFSFAEKRKRVLEIKSSSLSAKLPSFKYKFLRLFLLYIPCSILLIIMKFAISIRRRFLK